MMNDESDTYSSSRLMVDGFVFVMTTHVAAYKKGEKNFKRNFSIDSNCFVWLVGVHYLRVLSPDR